MDLPRSCLVAEHFLQLKAEIGIQKVQPKVYVVTGHPGRLQVTHGPS